MNDADATIVRRIVFLEGALHRMGADADDAERELRFNPTDSRAGQRLGAIYALASEVWTKIQELRSESAHTRRRDAREALG